MNDDDDDDDEGMMMMNIVDYEQQLKFLRKKSEKRIQGR